MSDPGLRDWSAAPRSAEPGRPALAPRAAGLPRLALVPPAPAVRDPNRFMPGIEALRGLAAIAVVVCHMWALTTATLFPGWQVVVGLGQWAVNLFFALSGFLLVSVFWTDGPRPSLREFYVRRFLRIAPAYWLSVVVLFLFLADRAVVFSEQGLRQALANLTFTQWLFPTTAGNLNVNGVYWTLSLEVVLYALLPAFAWLIARRPVVSGIGIIGVSVAYRLYVALDGRALEEVFFSSLPGTPEAAMRLFLVRQFPGIVSVMVLGMLLRWWIDHRPPAGPRRLAPGWLLVLLAPSVVLLAWVTLGNDYRQWAVFTSFDLWLGLLLLPALAYASADLAGQPAHWLRALMWLGRRSYGIYLWHFPIILLAFDRGAMFRPADTSWFWVRVAGAAGATVLLGALSFRFVEEPARRWGRRLGARGAPTGQPPLIAWRAAP
jgi:peptidoglycan/LPS O-acetylase OafA/YrhL